MIFMTCVPISVPVQITKDWIPRKIPKKKSRRHYDSIQTLYGQKKARHGIRAGTNLYPIQCLTEMYNLFDGIVCQNVKAVSFIHLFARLAIEFGTFDEQERGGLLLRDSINRNVLHRLMHTSLRRGQGHIRRADNLFHTEMVKLKRAGLFLKKDILDFRLLSYMCRSCIWWFSEQKAKFIIDWDQNSLMTWSSDGKTLLHRVACHQSTKGFRFLLDQTMQHFGKQMGVATLFITDDANETPLRIACQKLNRQDIMKIVEETLANYPNPPLNNASLMIHMAKHHQKKFNHLDCVHFLIRRQPNILMDWRLPITNKDDATTCADIDVDNNGRQMVSKRNEDHGKRKREGPSIQPPSL